MGAKQSKRSVDITTTPKKEVLTEGAPGGDMKIEKLEEIDVKPTTNGVGPHADSLEDKDKDEANEKDEDKTQGDAKSEETEAEATVETPAEGGEVTTPTETTPATPNTATPDNKETKKKEKSRKKWSFRSISFSRKDKNKPAREEPPKNGHISTEPLMEGGEDNENAAEATTNSSASPAEEKSEVVSPTESKTESVAEVKEEQSAEKPTTEAIPKSPVEAKKEEPVVPSPTALPVVENKKEEIVEKTIEADKKLVEKIQPIVVLTDNNAIEVITENGDDPPKIPPPAIPIEIPIVPPSAPVITEDVASVTKAIEEIEISDKAVAAAVNEAMESNDLIADGHHQNDMIE